MQTLFHSPGQIATIFLTNTGSDGYLLDTPSLPSIDRLVLPDLTDDDGYPQNMTKLDTGIYYFEYTIPSGASAVGTYLIKIVYEKGTAMDYTTEFYQIIVTAPYGIYSATVT